MSNRTIVPYIWCGDCNKRGFSSRSLARKALGRVRAKRNRLADKHGTRRGVVRENRAYICPGGLWHLTGMSRRLVRR